MGDELKWLLEEGEGDEHIFKSYNHTFHKNTHKYSRSDLAMPFLSYAYLWKNALIFFVLPLSLYCHNHMDYSINR